MKNELQKSLRHAAVNIKWLAFFWWLFVTVYELFPSAELMREDKFINPTEASISSKALKTTWKQTSKRTASTESELRPTYKLKLIKTINYLMLFRVVELVWRTQQRRQQQQHKMIKFFPSIPFSVATHRSHTREGRDRGHTLNHLIVFIHKSILMFYFVGRCWYSASPMLFPRIPLHSSCEIFAFQYPKLSPMLSLGVCLQTVSYGEK